MSTRTGGALVAALALAGMLAGPRPAHGQQVTATSADPPLQITADNMTGGRDEAGDVVMLNGNLHITRGRTLITADAGRYLRAIGMLYLDGHVRVVDSSTTVTANHASYSENDDLLQLTGDVVILDKDVVLKAPAGTYDRRSGRVDLSGGVQATDKQQRLVADAATYLRDSSVVKARGHVQGFDLQNKLELNANAIDYDRRSSEAIATGDPVLKSKDDDGKETLIRALQLRVNSSTKMAEAIDSVTVERDTLRGRADYARFDDQMQRGFLLGRPRVWDGETTVNGDTLELQSEARKLKRVVVRGHAEMDYAGQRATNRGETSRLTGNRVDAYVAGDRIDSLKAVGQARNAYGAPLQSAKTQETNVALGDTITVFFKDRKVDRARVTGNASGEYRGAVAQNDTVAIQNEIVRYDGKRIDFIVPKSQIVLEGQAHLNYRELDLTARRVEFDSEKQTLVAQGTPQLVDRGDKVNGHLMTYDLESRTGTIYQAETRYEKGLYHGERIRKAGDNILDVLNGSYSTCDLDPPHYHFSSRWMKIYLKDKLVAKPVVFYLRNIPILALPFYVFPIKPGRHSGFVFPQFEFGFNNRAGQFIRNAGYYWAPNDYMDYTLSGDYYQADPSWVLRSEANYKLLYVLEGHAQGSFARNEGLGRDDYDFNADHSQEITPRTHLIARGEFVSRREFNVSDQFGRPLAERLNRNLVSALSVSHNADWASFNFTADRRQDLDADQSLLNPLVPVGTFASLPSLTASAPSISFSFPTRTLGSLAIFKDTRAAKSLQATYFSFNGRFLSQIENTAFVKAHQFFTAPDSTPDSATVLGQRHTTRRALATNASMSDARRLFGWLNVTPSVSANAVVFDFDEQGHKVVPAAVWNAGVGTSATFYGTFHPPIPGLVGLRHVLFPSVSLNYSPEFPNLTFRDPADTTGALRERFRGFGGIGVSGFKNARMNFSLDQRFQVKVKQGEKITRLDNLFSWTTSGSYNFLWKEQNQKHPLSPIGSSMRFQPPGVFAADLAWTTDPYGARPVRALSYNLSANLVSGGRTRQAQNAALPVEQTASKQEIAPAEEFRESWSLGLAYSYSGGYPSETITNWSSARTANGVLRYKLTPNWSGGYSASYDVTNHNVVTQRFELTRLLHCWQASFTRSFSLGGEAEYYFRIGIVDQREIYLERGTRVQSLGGIQ